MWRAISTGVIREGSVLVMVGNQLGFTAALVAQVINVAGWGFSRESGPYLFGVSWLVVNAGVMFYRLVTLPVPEGERPAV
jgi:hypothetical protein